ncbi:hypothetical protein B5X24_HaOG214756 [Helicoverpa armigera]|uniref:Uncharacterized protein n=1 Tax=Helicoverpa armigera TaxID=29058 RepID=A0A2W1BD01_HELAM|nr:hypothetical protein B5X24_HaOG214756 [Helicoverpa armigera]
MGQLMSFGRESRTSPRGSPVPRRPYLAIALKRSEFPWARDDTPCLSETPLNNVAVSFGKFGRFGCARAFVIVILSSSFTYDVPRTSIEF